MTKISGYLKKYDKAERPFKIAGYLKEVGLPGHIIALRLWSFRLFTGPMHTGCNEANRFAIVRLVVPTMQVQKQGDDLYLPTNPDSRVRKLIPESGTPMQSAAKVPILVAFEVESMGTHGNPDEVINSAPSPDQAHRPCYCGNIRRLAANLIFFLPNIIAGRKALQPSLHFQGWRRLPPGCHGAAGETTHIRCQNGHRSFDYDM